MRGNVKVEYTHTWHIANKDHVRISKMLLNRPELTPIHSIVLERQGHEASGRQPLTLPVRTYMHTQADKHTDTNTQTH